MEALKSNGIKLNKKFILQLRNEMEGDALLIKKLLSARKRPDGVFASVENLAIATYHVCDDLKIKIPRDIKIISFSNLRTASLLNPSLSTITQPAFEIGKEAGELLFRKIEKKSNSYMSEHLVLKSSLIAREHG